MRAESSESRSLERAVSRRTMLRGAALGTAAVATAPAVGDLAAAQSGGDLGSWFEGVSNYDGVVDRTGESEVTVKVGASGNNGNFAFGPAAVRVDPGTTVVWEWTGQGSIHNVSAEDGSFESEQTDEEGFTFEQTFDEAGVTKYVCTPHATMGMRGAVVVGDVEVGGSASSSDGSSSESEGGLASQFTTGQLAIGGSILAGLLSPLAFGLVLFKRDPDRPD
ncbi:halocyanin domain-containing protein [Halorussus litoreus]|uniref:halocyanin domain-containing protein n=1 Tax=Halorussus litoreus TaxID=1710536 RepID=UPI0018E4E967|nr:halocyanin domain-containing protein [Halorussus litoreus]